MISIQHSARRINIFFQSAGLAPWQRQNPFQIVPHHRRLSAHRAHIPQLFKLSLAFFQRGFRHFCVFQLGFNLIQLVNAIFIFAQFLLNGLHLLVQIIFTLGLFHLPFDPVTHPLFHLQCADFAFHIAKHPLKPYMDIEIFKKLLLFGNLDSQMRGDHVGNFVGFVDLLNRVQHF